MPAVGEPFGRLRRHIEREEGERDERRDEGKEKGTKQAKRHARDRSRNSARGAAQSRGDRANGAVIPNEVRDRVAVVIANERCVAVHKLRSHRPDPSLRSG